MIFFQRRSQRFFALFAPFWMGVCLAGAVGLSQSNNIITLAAATGPAEGQPGVTSISLAGSNYPSGTINPNQVQIMLTPAATGAGPTVSLSPSSVTTLTGTSRRLFFTIPSTISVASPVLYLVSISGQTAGGIAFVSGNSAALTIDPAAKILSISPNSALAGSSLSVTITGQYTNFTQGSTVANFGAGISVGGGAAGASGPVTVVNQTTATAQLAIAPAAAIGKRSPQIQTGIQIATLANGFTVNSPPTPTITAVTPNSGKQGQQLSIGITGQNTHFAQGVSTVTFGSGVIVDSLAVHSATSATANVEIASDAALGTRTVTVSTGGEIASLAGAFTISTSGCPVSSPLSTGTTSFSDNFNRADGTVGNGWLPWIAPAGTVAISENQLETTGYPFIGGGVGRQMPVTFPVAFSFDFRTAQIKDEFNPSDPSNEGGWFIGFNALGVSEDSSNAIGFLQYSGTRGILRGNANGFDYSNPGPVDYNPAQRDFGLDHLSSISGMINADLSSTIKVVYNDCKTPSATIIAFNPIAAVPPSSQGGYLLLGNSSRNYGPHFFDNVTVGMPTSQITNSVTPKEGAPGQRLSVKVVSTAATFVPGTQINFGSGITIGSINVINPTTLTATISIDATASEDSRNVVISTPNEQINLVKAFVVAQAGSPRVSVTPNSGVQGQQNISVSILGTNTHFAPGTTTANFGSGITVASLIVSSPTSATALLNIAASATVGTRDVSVTTGAEVGSLANGFTVLSPPATITTVSPNFGPQGLSGPVGLVGQNTHFVQGVTTLDFGAGITVSNIVVGCTTCLAATLAVAANATPGPRNVTATTGTEVAILSGGFTVVVNGTTPVLTSIAPIKVQQGQSVSIAITGRYTHFAQGTTQVSFGSGITTTSVSVTSATGLSAQIKVDPAAALGSRTVTVTTGGESESVANQFSVTAPTPILYSLNPGVGQQGQQNLTVAITGVSTHFQQSTTQAAFGQGVTVVSLTVSSATSATAVINIAGNATLGARTVVVTTGSETASFVNGFTINSPGPIVSSVNPGGTSQGAQNFPVSITGLNTHWVQGTTTASFGTGITIASLTVISATAATAVINVDPAAIIGPRTVTLTTASEVASFANGFSIVHGVPGITQIFPANGQQGQQGISVAVTAQYTQFAQGTTTANFGAGVTVSSLTITSSTTATAVVNVDPAASVGARLVTFTTGSEIVTAPGGFTVTAGSPALVSVSPNTGQQGQQGLAVTLTGKYTHFAQGTTQAFFGANITVTSVTVNSATSATVLINIGSTATTGLRKVSLQTGSEVASLNNIFDVTPPNPVLVSANPNNGHQGQPDDLAVTITGQNTHFAQGATLVNFGTSGIIVVNLSVASATSLTAVIRISPTAALGPKTITVTSGSESVSLPNGFTILPPLTTPLTVSPNSGLQGKTLTVTITAPAAHFVQGTTKARFGPGVAVGSGVVGSLGPVTVTNATTATAQLTILTSAMPAGRTVTVQTGSEQVSADNAFTVLGAPYLLSASPDHANHGQTVNVTVNGAYTHFVQGTTLVSFGAGISVGGGTAGGFGSVTVNNPTSFTAQIAIAANAILGPRTITAKTGSEQASTALNFSVLGPVTGAGPQVAITSPAEASDVTAPTTVTGTVTSPNPDYWTLSYLAVGATTPTEFARGTGSAVSAKFDPTLLLNGNTPITLTALDTSGQAASVTVSVVVDRYLKIGNFTVSFNDLSVPVAGLPIQVVRTYDSRFKGNGDFGVGWRLDVSTAQITENIPLSDQWYGASSGGRFPTYCLQALKAHKLTVTLNDGTTYEFVPAFSGNGCQQFQPPNLFYVTFTPTGTTPANASLAILGNNQTLVTDEPWPGDILLLDSDLITPFDPDQYVLTLPDGRSLQLSRQSGLQKMTDLNGNTLSVSPTGITSSTGKSVTFLRDAQQRIQTITDPNGNVLNYAYDANGDLSGFTDALNEVSTYTYDSKHDLLTIQDPRHVQPIRNDYDENGRLVSHTDAYGNVINYTNDPNTSQETVTDRLGNLTVNQYDSAGNIVKVTDALGGITARTYDANGNTLSQTNTLGFKTTDVYDANNNKTSETDPLGGRTSYTYNGRNQVLTITDANAHATTNVYDANGNLTSAQDAAGNQTTYTYNTRGLQTSMKDPLGNVTQYQYDASGNLTQKTDALQHVTVYTYDNNGNKKSETTTRTTTNGQETLITGYQYDASNRLIQTTYPDGSITQIQYNNIGKQAVTVDQLNRQTSYQYDLMGRLLKTIYPDGTSESSAYDAEGDRISSTDRAQRTTTFVYDALKRLYKTIYPDQSSTQTGYDAIGEVKSVTDALGNATQYKYDAAGHRTQTIDALGHATIFHYDPVGNQTSMTDANNNTTQYQYDHLNRRTTVVYPDSTTAVTAYDGLGRTISKTDQATVTTQYHYDALGRLTQVTDALSQATKYGYDELGNRLSQTDANNHTTTFEYDKLGRRTQRTLPAGQSESMTYDAAGNLQTKTDFNGKTTTYEYAPHNNWLTAKVPDASFSAPTVSFTYTATGQRQSMTDVSGTTNYTYDSRDRLIQKATPEGTLTYTYDFAGNLKSIRSSNTGGTSVDYTYDADNRLSSVKDNRLASGTTTYSYDNAGNLRNYLYPNGVQTNYTYNGLNRLTNLAIVHSGTTLASYAYQVGPAGNRTQVNELGGRQVNYTYDNLYRLKSEAINVTGLIGYQYDPVGNRLQRTSTVATVPAASYTYDSDDRLSSDTYDANGSTIASNGKTYAYDFENHLISNNGGQVTISYDGDGNRIAETVAGITTQYLIDDRNLTGYAQVVEELSAGAVQRLYTYGLNRVSQTQSTSATFYGYDGHGSARILTDAAGAVTDRYDYDAFGSLVSLTGGTPNVYFYSGEERDPNLSFYYLRARYLNPDTGRFVTSDLFPATGSDPKSLHRYVYADSDPVNRNDPSGLLTVIEVNLTLTINNILSVYQDKLLFPIYFQSVQCAECVIAPATQMYNFALNALSDGAGAWAQELLWHAQSQLVQGYGAIRGIIAQNYIGFFGGLVTDSAKVKADFRLPFLKIVYDEVFSEFPALAAAASAGQVVNRGTTIIKKVSALADGVADAFAYWKANPRSNCGRAMLFGALGAELSEHMLDFGSTEITAKYSYSLDGMTDAEYRTYVQSVIQQIEH